MPIVIAGIAIVAGGLLLAGLAVWAIGRLDVDIPEDLIEVGVLIVLLLALVIGLGFTIAGLVELCRYFELHYEMEANQ
jgi:hypothetical protein